MDLEGNMTLILVRYLAIVFQTFVFHSNENKAKYKITITPIGSPATITYYDKFDRVVLVKTKRFDGEEISVETEYNEKGEVKSKSLPHTEAETAQYIVYTYDEQGRPIATVKPSAKGGTATVSLVSIRSRGI